MRLYHFIDEKYGIEDLNGTRLKVARISDLNDPTEFLAAELSNEELNVAMEQMRESLSNDHGILCFSKDWKSLAQWAHYANKHKGLCLGFDIPDHCVAKVEYSEQRLIADEFLDHTDTLTNEMATQMTAYIDRHASSPEFVSPEEFANLKEAFLAKECGAFLREHTESHQNIQKFMLAILTTKGAEWKYEKEYRMFVRLDSCEHLRQEWCGRIKDLHFVRFPTEDLILREVIAGYRCDISCEEIMNALGEMADHVTIRKARISRSEYAVVEDI